MIRRLLIEGDRFQCARMAADRGIVLAHEHQFVEARPSGERVTVCHGLTSTAIDALLTWHAEPASKLMSWTPSAALRHELKGAPQA